MHSARLLYNPSSGGAGRARELEQAIGELRIAAEVCRSPQALTESARRVADSGAERLLVAGGDGTMHAAIRALAGSRCALGIVPTGTGNDLARALGLLGGPRETVRRALEAAPRRIDLGRVDGIPFAGVAGIGLDSEVNRYIARRFRGSRRPWMYAWATLRTAFRYDAPRVRVEVEGERIERRALFAALANSPIFGGGMRIAPAARFDDGRLDLVVIARLSFLRALLLFGRVYRGTHLAHPAVLSRSVSEATLGADREITVYADGEPLCELRGEPVAVRAWPAALSVA